MNRNKKKLRVYEELFYILGITALALGTAMMEKADFGMSMVVAPAYVIHLKVSQTFSFFSFGMAEYTLQFMLLIIMMLILKEFKISYLFSIVTAFIYGNILDLFLRMISVLTADFFGMRVVLFAFGMALCAMGVAMLFHNYLAPEVYELFVKVIAEEKNLPISKVKTVYDITSCLVSILLSFAFFGFGHFEGIKAGTIICALLNGSLIGWFDNVIKGHCEVKRVANRFS